MTLDRFAAGLKFAPVVGADDVQYGKPDPEGMLRIMSEFPGERFYYIGDTVDDARSAKLAGVPFIGIGHGDTGALLLAEGAQALIPSINDLAGALESL